MGDPVWIPWVGSKPRRREWQPTPVFLPGECHGQRSLAGYSPWGGKESDRTEATEHACCHAKVLVTQLCPTLCHTMDCSPPGSSVHGILQARTLEWVAMTSSMGSSQPKDQTCVSHISCIGRQVLYYLSQ